MIGSGWRVWTYLMEVPATPFGSLISSVTIEDGKESLAADASIIDNVGMGILHCSPCSLFIRYSEGVGGELARPWIRSLKNSLEKIKI